MLTTLFFQSWGHDPSEIPMNSCIPLLCEALQHSAVLVQAYASTEISETKHIPFPLSTGDQGIFFCQILDFFGKKGIDFNIIILYISIR